MLGWFIPICIFCAGLNFSMGCNDESMGSAYGSRALGIRTALILGAVTEMAGSVLFGSMVATTIQGKLFSLSVFGTDTTGVMVIILASLFGATFWLVFSSYLGLPTSSTHSIIGAVVIAAMAARGVSIVRWDEVGKIVGSWFLSPLLGGAAVCIIYFGLHVTLLWNRQKAYERCKRFLPLILFVCLTTLGLFVALKGIQLPKNVAQWEVAVIVIGVSAGLSIAAAVFGMPYIIRRIEDGTDTREFPDMCTDARAEKLFSYLQIFSASLFSFARGSNDSSHGAGPFALAIAIYIDGVSSLKGKPREIDVWVLAIGGVAMAGGLILLGQNVVMTVGDSLTKITPTSGVMTELATAIVVLGFSALGLPISSTHTMVGTIYIMGVFRHYVIEQYFVEHVEHHKEPATIVNVEISSTPKGTDAIPVKKVSQNTSEECMSNEAASTNTSTMNAHHGHPHPNITIQVPNHEHHEPVDPHANVGPIAAAHYEAAEDEELTPKELNYRQEVILEEQALSEPTSPGGFKEKLLAFYHHHKIVFKIVCAWIITIPVSGAVAALAWALLNLAA